MGLREVYRDNDFVLSYELFPPKSDAGMEALGGHVRRLLEYSPDFVTCTYGAGGSTRDKTLATLAVVQGLSDRPVASHLTCVGGTYESLRRYLGQARDQGVSYIVAIRGDAPKDDPNYRPVDNGPRYGNELVAFVRAEFPEFGIAVGGYPETHPEAKSADADIDHLKRKVDAGADVVITQLFYTNADFYRFRDRCAAAGIDAPIVPGLLPIINFKQVQRITSLCGAVMPPDLASDLEACGDEPEAQFDVGVRHATKQAADLREQGVPGIHFYVLNQSRATAEVLDNIGIRR